MRIRSILGAFVLALSSYAQAATLTVTNGNDDGPGSLRAMIAAADAGDTIVFASNVTTVTLSSIELFIPKSLTIEGNAGLTTITRQSIIDFHLMTLGPGVDQNNRDVIILRRLNLTNGNAVTDGGATYADGGAMYVKRFTVVHFDDSVAANNHSTNFGGAVYLERDYAEFHAKRSRFTNNNSASSVPGNQINFGNAGIGGAISLHYGGVLELNECLFNGNSSRLAGGSIYATSADTSPLVVNIVNTTFANNLSGGCDWCGSAVVLFDRSTIPDSTTLYLGNNTFAGNGSGKSQSTVSVFKESSQTANFQFKNNLLYNPAAGLRGFNGFPAISLGGNVFDDTIWNTGNPSDVFMPNGSPAPYDVLSDNGGPTHTLKLTATSPAIDKAVDCAGLIIDQRGQPRPVDGDNSGGAQCDSGAFELQPTDGDIVFKNGFE